MLNRGLSGKLLPVHFKPQDDELLSSWICRLSLAHGLNSGSFYYAVLPSKSSKQGATERDIDRNPSEEIIATMAEKSGTPIKRVVGTTLAGYEGILFENRFSKGSGKWILPVRGHPSTILRPGMQFCPKCLAEDGEPYYRRTWRLAFITLCTKHGTQLFDCCIKCNAPVFFTKAISNGQHESPSDHMTFCYSCKADFRDAVPESARLISNTPSDAELAFQERLEKAVEEGWVEVPGSGPIYTLLYFPVLYQVMRLLASGERGRVLREILCREYGFELFSVKSTDGRMLNLATVSERRGLVQVTRQLLDGWPNEFVAFCSANKLWSQYLLDNFKLAPFWFWSVVHEHLTRTNYARTVEEVESATRYLNRMRKEHRPTTRGFREDLKAASEFLGDSSPRMFKVRKLYSHGMGVDKDGLIAPRQVSDSVWNEVELIIISHYPNLYKRKLVSYRKYLNGMVYVLCTGCLWRKMPNEFGSYEIVRLRYYRWRGKGIFEQIWKLCSHLYSE